MKIEVCYAEAASAMRITVTLAEGATVADAVRASGIVEHLALVPESLTWALFGRRTAATSALADGDRVELLRPLQVDPKEARRRRVLKRRTSDASPRPTTTGR